jgi:hypothetical protein
LIWWPVVTAGGGGKGVVAHWAFTHTWGGGSGCG